MSNFDYSGCYCRLIMFHFILWLMPSVIVLYLPLSYQCPFALFHSWSLVCLCFFPLVDIHVQVSITLNEFRYVTSCVNLLSFQSMHPGFMFGLSHGLVSLHLDIHIGLVHWLPNGILLKVFIATIGDMYAFQSLKKACFHFRCTLYVPCSLWYEFKTRLISVHVIDFMFNIIVLE